MFTLRSLAGLPEDMTNLEMYQIFAPFGPIAPRGATALLDKARARSKRGTRDTLAPAHQGVRQVHRHWLCELHGEGCRRKSHPGLEQLPFYGASAAYRAPASEAACAQKTPFRMAAG